MTVRGGLVLSRLGARKNARLSALSVWFKQVLSTRHGIIVFCGLSVGLCYFPVWFAGLWVSESQGSAGLPLLCAVVYLGFVQLWNNRVELAQVRASLEDRLLGHVLIVSGLFLFPLLRFAIWPQAAIWLFVLAGVAISTWGVGFFARYPLLSALVALGTYPKIGVMSKLLWQAATPPMLLERLMARLGSYGLQCIGQDAISRGAVIELAGSSVSVDWGCNGFNMALSIAAAAWLMGIFLHQCWQVVVGMILGAIALSLVFNVPRIMLLTLAHTYWGHSAFGFFHGPIGGQLFSGILLTVYYYAAVFFIGSPSTHGRPVER